MTVDGAEDPEFSHAFASARPMVHPSTRIALETENC